VIRQELLITTIKSLEDRNKTPDQYIQSGRDWGRKREKKIKIMNNLSLNPACKN